jgi:hypothetical protein
LIHISEFLDVETALPSRVLAELRKERLGIAGPDQVDGKNAWFSSRGDSSSALLVFTLLVSEKLTQEARRFSSSVFC